MKKIIFCLGLVFFFTVNHAKAQVAYAYYTVQSTVTDQPVGSRYPKYDGYGNYMGTFQIWQRAVWHSEGIYYWYEWVNYERYLGY